jgi:hypothetical protein
VVIPQNVKKSKNHCTLVVIPQNVKKSKNHCTLVNNNILVGTMKIYASSKNLLVPC